MSLRAFPQATPTVIQQRITEGAFFDGTMPTGDAIADRSNALYKYEAQAAGGLFLWSGREPLVLTQLLVDLGNAGDVTVKVVNIDPETIEEDVPTILAGEELTYQAETGVSRLMLNETNFRITLLPFQAMQLITTGTEAAQIAQCTAYLARPRQW